jgi:hypothetical protein
MLPLGLAYIESWAALDESRCYQLMEAADEGLVQKWTRSWDDLVSFEIVPVIPSREMQAKQAAAE